MARPLPVDYLQPDEEVLHETGRHPLSVVDELLGTFVLLAAVAAATWWLVPRYVPGLWWPVGVPVLVACGAGFLLFALTRYWRVATSRYVITPERTYMAYGRLRFNLLQTTYDKVTDLHVRQSVFGRLWGFGTVRLETAGTGIALDGVRDPFGYKRRIESARTGFLRTLVSEYRPARRAAPARSAGSATVQGVGLDVESPPAWSGSPSLASFLGSGLQAALMLLVAFIVGAGAAFTDPRLLLVPLLLVVVAALSLWRTWIVYRYTHYMVHDWGVVVTAGWLTRRRVETTYDKVTDVTVYQGLLGRVLGYGSITVNTAGGNQAPVVFAGLTDPENVKRTIDGARRRREGRA